MRSVVLAHQVDFAGWRDATRRLCLEGVPPEDVRFAVGAPDDLFAEADAGPDTPTVAPPFPAGSFTVTRQLMELASGAIQHSDPERFALLYDLVWRAQHGEKRIAEVVTDATVQRVVRLNQSVRRDIHKMRAFVRFREVQDENGIRYVSWFEPEHYIVESNADFFARRFATMVFTILTPYRSVHWTGNRLEFGPGADPSAVPDDDALERYWRIYFSAIFNPARLKIAAMRSEMPKKYWRNLPEAAAIPEMIREAGRRTEAMLEAPMSDPSTQRRIPAAAPATPELDLSAPAERHSAAEPRRSDTLRALAARAAECRNCPLWEPATQVVFGEGPEDARMMMVGEQPGDQEDLAGRPFVGPAGQLLDRAIAEAGIDRRSVYVTNAVKHFKFEPRGRRRIHAKPDLSEIRACNPWLEQERAAVKPALVVMLGATAARAVLGRAVTIGRERSRPIPLPESFGSNAQGFVTVHPSFLLRLPDEDAKQREYAAFVADLRRARELVEA